MELRRADAQERAKFSMHGLQTKRQGAIKKYLPSLKICKWIEEPILRKVKIFLFALFLITFCLGIAACGQSNNEPPEKLAAPQNLQMDGRTLVWDENENASFYVVYFEFVEHTTHDASFDLSELLSPNTYEIEVMAAGDGSNYENSDWVKYLYTPEEILPFGYDERGLKYTLLDDESGYEVSRGDLSYNDKRLSGFVEMFDYYCGLPVKKIADDIFHGRVLNTDTSTGYGCNTVITGVHLPKKLEIIGENAFPYCILLEKINIPDTVTTIGELAFSDCVKLKEINIPSGLKTIESGVFYGTDLTKAILPNNVTSIGDRAFAGCKNLTEVVLPNNLESIGKAAFLRCSSLSKINVPQSIKRLEDDTFRDCDALYDIPILHNLEYMGMNIFEGTPWYESQPDGFVLYGKDILYRFKGALPEGGAINNLPSRVKYIAGGAFAKLSDLTSISLPDGVKIIGGCAFEACSSLADVRLPQGLTCINKGTFRYCTSLRFIEVPEGVKTLEMVAFNSCLKLTEIVLPASLECVGKGAFHACMKFTTVFFKGTPAQWEAITVDEAYNSFLTRADIYFYSESKPTAAGNYWHYVDGQPVIW